MAGTAAVFRITTHGDTEATALAAGQIIEFNGGTSPDARSFLESVQTHWTEDISEHPNPKKALNKLQDGLLGRREVIITGWFSDPDNAGGPAKISTWMKEAKTNASLPNGRFGLRINDFQTISDLTPSATVGLMLYDADIVVPPDHPYEANFTLRFWMAGTHP